MTEKIIVMGHKNPDTDSICSALAYAQLKELLGEKDVIPGRAGNINKQTEFVLKYFNIAPPVYFSDLYPRLLDIMVDDPISAKKDRPIIEIMKVFKEKRIGFMPVIDQNEKIIGTIETYDMTEQFSCQIDPEKARTVYATSQNIALATDSRVFVDNKNSSEKKYYVFVGAMSKDSFVKRIAGYNPTNLIIIVGDREDILKKSIENGVGIIIISGGLMVSDEIIKYAAEKGISLMSTPHDSATAAWLVKLSTPASRLCSKKYNAYSTKEKVETAKRSFLRSGEKGLVITDENNILLGVVTKRNFMKSPNTKLIMVDHNEFSQSVSGADQVEVIEVIDHHRIANFQTALPININIQPVGSTCTLIAEEYNKNNIDISGNTAGLLLSGIISDTLTGRSPTTTRRDLDAMDRLKDICKINIDKYSNDMFEASSIIGHKSPEEIILNDFKEFIISGKKIGIGQIEVVGFSPYYKIKDGIRDALADLQSKKQYTLVGLMVTDITYEITLFQVAASSDIYKLLGLPELEKNIFEMKGVLSRKKQVVPLLHNILLQG